jgi:hypothetical protein
VNLSGLLRARSEGPWKRRAAEKSDELPPLHTLPLSLRITCRATTLS